jgi:membrane-bound ClpP family serine protease
LAGLAIGTFVFGMICLFTVKMIVTYAGSIAEAVELRPETVFITAIAALITPVFYMSSAYIGRAWRRQKAGEPSRTSTWVGEASDQLQASRQQATVRLSGETWTPRQQAMVGLIGTIAAALIGLFGTLVTVFLSAD